MHTADACDDDASAIRRRSDRLKEILGNNWSDGPEELLSPAWTGELQSSVERVVAYHLRTRPLPQEAKERLERAQLLCELIGTTLKSLGPSTMLAIEEFLGRENTIGTVDVRVLPLWKRAFSGHERSRNACDELKRLLESFSPFVLLLIETFVQDGAGARGIDTFDLWAEAISDIRESQKDQGRSLLARVSTAFYKGKQDANLLSRGGRPPQLARRFLIGNLVTVFRQAGIAVTKYRDNPGIKGILAIIAVVEGYAPHRLPEREIEAAVSWAAREEPLRKIVPELETPLLDPFTVWFTCEWDRGRAEAEQRIQEPPHEPPV